MGCSPPGHEESDTTERLHFHFSLSCIGEGNGNPLQCSCLENPRDCRAWWAAIYGVAQSQTQQKRLSSSSNVQGNGDLGALVCAWCCHIPGTSQAPLWGGVVGAQLESEAQNPPTRWCSAFRRHILLAKAGSSEPHVMTGSLPRAVDTRSELASHHLPRVQPLLNLLGWATSCKQAQGSSAPW